MILMLATAGRMSRTPHDNARHNVDNVALARVSSLSSLSLFSSAGVPEPSAIHSTGRKVHMDYTVPVHFATPRGRVAKPRDYELNSIAGAHVAVSWPFPGTFERCGPPQQPFGGSQGMDSSNNQQLQSSIISYSMIHCELARSNILSLVSDWNSTRL